MLAIYISRVLNLTWNNNLASREWDRYLAMLNAHPHQSALWGESRRKIDGHDSLYFAYVEGDTPLWMARAEIRKLPGIKVAWIPRGPASSHQSDSAFFFAEFCALLRREGISLVVTDEYSAVVNMDSAVRTIWLDLEQGLPALEKKMDKQWRYGVRKAAKLGVEVQPCNSSEDLATFHEMCLGISQTKGFILPGSRQLMECLLQNSGDEDVEMRLFLAKFEGKIGAGAFVARSGKHAHYLWGAANRDLSPQRVGEAVQWAVMEWAVAKGCTRYDLEGIDPLKNPGVYKFKKKMGGEEVALKGMVSYPLGLRGRLLKFVGSKTGRL